MADEPDNTDYLKRIAQDMKHIRTMMTQVVNAITEAESEIPEKMRRFIMYMHDVHDVSHMYEERGLVIPPHILREMERCDDRYRHLLEDLHAAGGTFEGVRQEMSQRPGNRWDHTKLLTEKANETGK